jgi:hypothetical protein
MRLLAFLHAWIHMVSTGQFYACEPVWSGEKMDTPSVACGVHVEPIAPVYAAMGYSDLVWYDLTCDPRGCWP